MIARLHVYCVKDKKANPTHTHITPLLRVVRSSRNKRQSCYKKRMSTAITQNLATRPVVAMPSGGGILNAAKYSSSSNSSEKNLSRPKSPARTPVSRSRDIVQEVYDRMGVQYVRGESSSNSASLELNNDTDSQSCSISVRSSAMKSPSRSGMSTRYNMYNNNMYSNNTDDDQQESDAISVRSSFSGRYHNSATRRWSSSRSVNGGAAITTSGSRSVVAYPSPKGHNGVTTNAALTYRDDGSVRTTPSYLVDHRNDGDKREAKEDHRESGAAGRDGEPCSNNGANSPMSVKSRVSRYAEHGQSTAASKNSKQSFATSPVAQKIYNMNNAKKSKTFTFDASSSGQKGNRLQQHDATTITPTQRSLRSGVANSFLAAINTKHGDTTTTSTVVSNIGSTVGGRPFSDLSSKCVPAEILPTEDTNKDDISIVSGDDFGVPDSSFDKSTANNNSAKMNNGQTLLSKKTVDQMIEAKLQAKLGEVYEMMEARIRQVEEASHKRLDEMETKLNDLMSTANNTTNSLEVDEKSDQDVPSSTKSHGMCSNSDYRPFQR